MYLKANYFQDQGPHPADDIGQGYLTFTVPAEMSDEVAAEITEFAKTDPDIWDQFAPDETLISELSKEKDRDSFSMFRNEEIAFDGTADCGYLGFGLDIAFSELRGIALVAYTGPGLPSVVRRYVCQSADEAAALWQ